MKTTIGSVLSNVLHKIEAPFEKDEKVVVADVKKAGDAFVSGVAPLVGYIELTGIKYPVTEYEAKVSDELTRGSRLDGDVRNYINLRSQGFNSIVDLTAEGTEDEKMATAQGFQLHRIKIIDNTAPTVAQMKDFLDFVTNTKNQPVYVHCEAGVGRTGVACACYRMAVEGWSAEDAIAEASKFGLKLDTQINFLRDFATQLTGGKVAGYPLKPLGSHVAAVATPPA